MAVSPFPFLCNIVTLGLLAFPPDSLEVNAQCRVERLVSGANSPGGGLLALAIEGEGCLYTDEGHDAIVSNAVGPGLGCRFDLDLEDAVGDVCRVDNRLANLWDSLVVVRLRHVFAREREA